MYKRVRKLADRLHIKLFGVQFGVIVDTDRANPKSNRVFVQLVYFTNCSKTGEFQEWRSRKWYLSEHMTDDEVIKTIYLAFEVAVKHEILEGFKVDNQILFNPHTPFTELLKVSNIEEKRS